VLSLTHVYAQNRTITGTVTAKDDGLPLPGVTVRVKGSTIGTQTNASGKFNLSVPANATIVFSFLGFKPVESTVPASGVFNLSLEITNSQLGEVIVTGTLGRKLEEKATGYASTHLTAAAVNQSAETNLLVGLSGKVAGLNISQTSTGVSDAVKVNLRGSRSINGSNSALIVVDGVPLPSGDISAIDPNTIESYDILNGGSAGALYGSEASNGVIVITTKKGSSTGKPVVTYSNSFQFARAAYYPKFQNQFGTNGGENIGSGGVDPLSGLYLIVPYENQLYGPQFNGQTYTLLPHQGSATGPALTGTYSAQPKSIFQQFYQTGIIEQNNISIASGNADDYFNVSAQYATNHGITPKDVNTRYNTVFKAGKRYGIFKAEYSLSYTNRNISTAGNSYYQGGRTIPYELAQLPQNIDLSLFKDPNGQFGNPSDWFSQYTTNPYWEIYNARNNTQQNIFLGNISLTLSPTHYLDINYKLNDAYGVQETHNYTAEVDFTKYAVSDPQGVTNVASFNPSGVIPGTVADNTSTGNGTGGYGRLQQDLIINFHPTLSRYFKTNLLLGSTLWNQHTKSVSNGASQLLIPGLYNLAYNGGTPTAAESVNTINQISYFGDATIGYKGWAFIDGSIRNEQDSRLTAAHRSYWYPGVSGSFVFSEAIPALRDNKILSFGKIRAAYSVTGQVNVGAYQINDTFGVTSGGFPYGALGGLSLGTTNYTTILPEKVTEIEVGTELGFFDNRIHGTFTYYKQNDRNQTLNISTSPSTGYSNVLTNVGELQSSGFEVGLNVSPLTKAANNFALDLGATLTNTESKVISLLPNVPQFSIGNGQYAIVGDPYPEVKGIDFQRDPQGRIIVSATTGLPLNTQAPVELGRTSPEWMLGLNLSASYKFISFSVTAEYRTGYIDDFNAAQTLLVGGSSAYTTQAGRQRFIFPNSVYVNAAGSYVPNTNISVQDGNYKLFQNTSIFSSSTTTNPTSPFVTSGAFWKIREANLTFNLNQFIKNKKYIKGLKFALTGNNLFMWVPKTNFWGDPEASTDSGNAGGTPTINNIPGQRILGAKLDVTF
jgi:TonB-linked SusC/RagA family outer membrane protein